MSNFLSFFCSNSINLEENFSLLEFSKIPEIVQYSSIINFSISNSLSQTNLRATD